MYNLEILKFYFNYRILKPLIAILIVLIIGTTGFYLIKTGYSDASDTTIYDSLYLAVITLSTVGFEDNLRLLDLREPGKTVGIIFIVSFIIFGYGVIFWAVSTFIARIVEGSLSGIIKKREMLMKIKKLENHFILCGIGRTGATMIDEFIKNHKDFVVIDNNTEKIEACKQSIGHHDFLYIEGDAIEDETLIEAGINKAQGLICNLRDDKDNLFLTLTDNSLNPNLKIVTHALDPKSKEKLITAGANNVVFPEQIGAMRMASEIIRPTVVTFLDIMLKDSSTRRVAEVTLPENSTIAGKSISNSTIYENTGLNIVAISEPGNDNKFLHNPSQDHIIKKNSVLLVIGEVEEVEKLEQLVKT